MRISDWSSDVCSSDLPLPGRIRKSLSPELIGRLPDGKSLRYMDFRKRCMAGVRQSPMGLSHQTSHLRAGSWHVFYLAIPDSPTSHPKTPRTGSRSLRPVAERPPTSQLANAPCGERGCPTG